MPHSTSSRYSTRMEGFVGMDVGRLHYCAMLPISQIIPLSHHLSERESLCHHRQLDERMAGHKTGDTKAKVANSSGWGFENGAGSNTSRGGRYWSHLQLRRMNMTKEEFRRKLNWMDNRILLCRVRMGSPLNLQTINALRLFSSVNAMENFFNTIKAPKPL